MKKHFSLSTFHFPLQKGFTLVEMLIVIGMVGVLASVVLVGLNPLDQLRKANDTDRKKDLSEFQKALELYYEDNNRYPASSPDFKVMNGTTTLAWGVAWNPYMKALPKDPVNARNYVYYSPASSNGQTYYVYASLERTKDPNTCNGGSACVSLGGSGFPTATACGTGATCNYAVSSPNVSP